MKISYSTISVGRALPGKLTTGSFGALFCFLVLLLTACSKTELFHISGPTMGTRFNITIVGVSPSRKPEIEAVVTDILAEANNIASTYIPDSELMRLNRAELNTPIEVSDKLFDMLVISGEVYELTNGVYDVTVGPLVNLWGFGSEALNGVPSDEKITETLALVGFNKLHMDAETKSVTRSVASQIDLSSVAKGYAVDWVAEYLESLGIINYLVEIGGELRVKGHNGEGERWRIGIESPSLAHTGAVQSVSIADVAVATSGDYRNFFDADGIRYSHTIDPSTGRPIAPDLASITILDKSTARADALATGLNAMGYERAQKVCEEQQLACFFIQHDGSGFIEHYSSAFKPYMQ
ncbi:FAD:protein FMN transferase [Halioxenophilus sp. WMMB6]|uniref:FAD:protein FMN transferase n=1 Tax=Halioxenophilus sp. WMMB6 TaxID=3073815 RepID=UPI00295F3A4B|nr:FAD:protein FMN transferase [Halioxenophilus sp. WMMB6]